MPAFQQFHLRLGDGIIVDEIHRAAELLFERGIRRGHRALLAARAAPFLDTDGRGAATAAIRSGVEVAFDERTWVVDDLDDAVADGLRRERLGDKFRHPGIARGGDTLEIRAGGEHEDRDIARDALVIFRGTDGLDERHAIDRRHVPLGDDDVVGARPQQGQRAFAIGGDVEETKAEGEQDALHQRRGAVIAVRH